MSEQERREEYNAQRREDERFCKHGSEVCEPCAYESGVKAERERCALLADNYRKTLESISYYDREEALDVCTSIAEEIRESQ